MGGVEVNSTPELSAKSEQISRAQFSAQLTVDQNVECHTAPLDSPAVTPRREKSKERNMQSLILSYPFLRKACG